jgi:hypothetical protein
VSCARAAKASQEPAAIKTAQNLSILPSNSKTVVSWFIVSNSGEGEKLRKVLSFDAQLSELREFDSC